MRSTRLLVLVLAVVGLAACGDNNSVPVDSAPDMGGIGTKCDDGIDNDGDGLIDYPADPGCVAPQADDETDDCPDGPGCPQCGNERDDDGNGSTDYPDDPGCTSASDTTEVIDDPVACGATLMIKNLPVTGMDTGMLDSTSTSQITSPCGAAGVSAIAYRLNLAMPTVIVAGTSGSMFDTVLDLRSADCDDASSEVACHDDVSGSNETSKITKSVPAGNYFLIISGADTSELGQYSINVERFTGEGSACTATAQCGPGLVCRAANGGANTVCAVPQCADTYDDDNDGKNGYPTDPGCGSVADNDETDPTPLPICSNGIDDDNDGMMDYPADTSCSSAGGTSEACNGEVDPIEPITAGTTNGTLVGAHDNHDPSCNSGTGVDVLYTVQLPSMRSLQLDTEGTTADTVLSLLNSTCAEPSLACDDDSGTSDGASRITRSNVTAGNYVVAVDNYSQTAAVGPIVVRVSGVIAPGGSCDPALTLGGALTCPVSNPCEGSAGSMRCRPTACGDGLDNDSPADGLTDFPMDPGCSSIDDNDESDTCAAGPGPGCPECADGIDNDLDGQADENDTACTSPGVSSEGCASTDGVRALTEPMTLADTSGDANDTAPACGSSSNTAPDHTYSLELPAMRQISIVADTDFNWDAVAALYNSTCGGTALACTDSAPETVAFNNLAAGNYFFVVDGYGSGSGEYVVTVDGVIQNGSSCEAPLAQSGAIRCGDGFACKGTAGARRCLRAACNDGVDNDTPPDGIADFPNDPGCTSRNDDDESDVCPGPSCPPCSDGLDNDGDLLIDYPDDPQCASAASPSEVCLSADTIVPLVLAVTADSNAGAANDETAPACGSSGNTAGDKVYSLTVPPLATLSIRNTNSFDASVALYDSTCGGADLDCADEPEDLSFTNLAAGTYYYKVDGYEDADDEGAYVIAIRGTIADGESCESPLVATGALRCTSGHTCAGAAGARTCQVAACADGADNDMDTKIDFPNDPGCESASDNDETNPAILPVCGNGLDDDADGDFDFPADEGCSSASGTTEVSLCTTETNRPIRSIAETPTTGTTTGATSNFSSQTCQSNASGTDIVLGLDLPVPVTTLALDLSASSFDTVLSLRDATCGTEIECDDDDGESTRSLITRTNVPAGIYSVLIDGYSGANGAYSLSVSGTVAAGTACSSPLFDAGVLACPTGTTCTGTPATCQ